MSRPLVLRGRMLTMVSGAGDFAFTLWRLVGGGKTCKTRLTITTVSPPY